MPVVPRFDSNVVASAPLPDVRVPTNMPAAAVGVPSTPNLSVVQQQVGEIIQREREKADTVALLDADNKLGQLQTDLHTQARQLRGRDAMGAAQQTSEAWQKGVSDITSGLNTDQQREAFQRRVGARWGTLYEAVETHAANERDAYAEQTAADSLKLRLEHATEFYQQPAAVTQSIDETKAILTDAGKHFGWSPETLAAKTQDAVTNIHASVIDRLVANRQDLGAAEYLTAHRDEMTGQSLIKAEQLVSHGSVLGAAQRSSDGIMKAAPNLSAALAEAAKILDPQVREQTEQQVRRSFEDKALAQREEQTQNEIAAGDIVRKTGRFDQVPPRLLVGMTPIQIRDLKLLEESLRRRPSDPETVIRLRNMSAFQKDEFVKLDLGQYHDQLSDADLRALQSAQRTLVGAQGRAAATTRTRQQKELTRLQTSADFFRGQKLDVPSTTAKRIRVLQDSLGTTPKAPGAPLPTTAGSGAPPAPLVLPGAKPDDDDPDTHTPIVPSDWLAHADENPDYAAYLETMGVRR